MHESAQKESAQKESAQKESAQKESAQKESAQKESAQKESAQEESAQNDRIHGAPLGERLRGLSTIEQLKIARGGEAHERTILERIYGKAVWPALVANARLTVPEVTRLARMGNMPRPQLEAIIGTGAWLQSPQVRRALLSNPRLTREMIRRVLRLTPKHELKLMVRQTAYPHNVRAAARELLAGR